MCNLYATWMRLGGNRNIQCKPRYGILGLDSCPNFFLPSQLKRGTHRVIRWQGRSLLCLFVHLWLLKEVGHYTKGVLGEMHNTDILQNTITSTKVENALKQMYEE